MGYARSESSSFGWLQGRGIDHRLLRARTLRGIASGDISLEEACDADPELTRAASHFGVERQDACPVCGQGPLVEVSFGFGRGLPREGQVIGGLLPAHSFPRVSDLAIYVVEVCLSCRWNFLLRKLDRPGEIEAAE